MFAKGIVAGWLIAALVWMLPSAEGTEIFVITLITYLIALGGFTHVVAGLGGGALSLAHRRRELRSARSLPSSCRRSSAMSPAARLLFAVLSYAQVREEIE